MSTELFDWKSRVTVYIEHDGMQYEDIDYVGSSNLVEIEVVTGHKTGEKAPKGILHGLKKVNVGTIEKPHVYTWSFDIPANTIAAYLLERILADNRKFRLITREDDTVPEDLQGNFVSEVEILIKAWVDSLEREFSVDDVPMYRFSGGALRSSTRGGDEKGSYTYEVQTSSTAS